MIPALVVTSWSEEGERLYGQRFMEGFERHWGHPYGIDIRKDLDEDILADPEVRAFRDREADAETSDPTNIHRGVMKWTWKVFALTMAPMPTSGWMIWIDGDVEFTKTPTREFFDAVCPDDADVSYLGRPWAYASETGFVAYNMARETTRYLLGMMREMYLAGGFRALPEWGDAGVLDHCRRLMTSPGFGVYSSRVLRENDLAAGATPGDLHVWPQTVLGGYLKHHKGPKRKQDAYG